MPEYVYATDTAFTLWTPTEVRGTVARPAPEIVPGGAQPAKRTARAKRG